MSDEKKIDWHPPLKLNPYNVPKIKIEAGNTVFDETNWQNKINYSSKVNTIFDIDMKNKEEQQKSEAKSLHNDWRAVMIAEAQSKPKKFTPDSNISYKFFEELTKTAERLNCNADDLAAVIYKESHFDPKAKGPGGYTGLIQMDETAFNAAVKHAVKTQGDKCNLNPNLSYAEYSNLPREEQLKYAEAYLRFRIDEKKLEGKISGGQINTLIHRPADITKPASVIKHQKQVDKFKQVPLKYKD